MKNGIHNHGVWVYFFVISGIFLLLGDPSLWIVWPVALLLVIYGTRVFPPEGISLIGGVPLSVAVGYYSLTAGVISVLLLIVTIFRFDVFLVSHLRAGGVILIVGSLVLLFAVYQFTPFIGMLIILLFSFLSGAILLLNEHMIHRSVRGEIP